MSNDDKSPSLLSEELTQVDSRLDLERKRNAEEEKAVADGGAPGISSAATKIHVIDLALHFMVLLARLRVIPINTSL